MKHFIIVGVLFAALSLTINNFFDLDSSVFTMLNVILGIIAIFIVQRIQEQEKK